MSKGTNRRQELSQNEYGEKHERIFGELVEGEQPVASSLMGVRPRPTSVPRVRER